MKHNEKSEVAKQGDGLCVASHSPASGAEGAHC